VVNGVNTVIRAVDSISKLDGQAAKKVTQMKHFTTFTNTTPKKLVGNVPTGPPSSDSPGN